MRAEMPQQVQMEVVKAEDRSKDSKVRFAASRLYCKDYPPLAPTPDNALSLGRSRAKKQRFPTVASLQCPVTFRSGSRFGCDR